MLENGGKKAHKEKGDLQSKSIWNFSRERTNESRVGRKLRNDENNAKSSRYGQCTLLKNFSNTFNLDMIGKNHSSGDDKSSKPCSSKTWVPGHLVSVDDVSALGLVAIKKGM